MDIHPESGNKSPSPISNRECLTTRIRKLLIIGGVLLTLLFIILMCLFVVSNYKPKPSKDSELQRDYVSFIGINSSVDPCVNFYEFTCGLWSENIDRNISSDFYFYNSFSLIKNIVHQRRKNIFIKSKPNKNFPRVVNDALKYHEYCMDLYRSNSSDIDYLLTFFDQMGGWPILNPKLWQEDNFNWIRSSTYLLKTLDLETVLGFQAAVNDLDPSSNILYIKAPTFESKEISLSNFFGKQILYVILYTLNPDIDDENILSDINEIQNLEVLWQKTFSIVNKTDPVRITLKDLQSIFPKFNWMEYIHLVMNETLVKSDLKFSENDIVMIDNIEFFQKVFSALQSDDSFSKKQVANLFGWFVVKDLFILIPGAILNYAEANGDSMDETRDAAESHCFEKTLEIYECSIDYMYVQNTSHSGVKDSKVLVDYLKKSFAGAFYVSDWLDEPTRNASLYKLSALQSVLGYKDYHDDKHLFDKIYEDFPLVSSNVLETFFKTKQFFASQIVYLLKHGNNKLSDFLPRSVTDVSAYYILQKNILIIPISMHFPPFYYKTGPWYLNFGALGAIIGHEIMHAFDKLGYQRGANGGLENWWTNASLERYNSRSDCFKEYYKHFYDDESKALITLNENIADNEGLQMAYLAYKLWEKDNSIEIPYPGLKQYSSEQMFFISFGSVWCSKRDDLPNILADVHSSPELRVNGAVSNSENFAIAFNCPQQSPMNPDKKCYLW